LALALVAVGGVVPFVVVDYGINRHGNVLVTVIVVVVVVLYAIRTALIALRIGVAETAGGLVAQTEGAWWSAQAKRDLVAWEDIDGFYVARNPPFGIAVFVARRSGSALKLPLRQDRLMSWKGGKTRDIASLLAERANAEIRARGLAREITVTSR